MKHGKMDSHSTAGLYAAAAFLRLLLFTFFPGLPDLLTARVEISTPVTSFKRCKEYLCSSDKQLRLYYYLTVVVIVQEGLFLYNHNVSPYDGGVFHQAPLLLPLFSLLPDPATYPIFTNLLYIAVDLLSAHALYMIAESGEAQQSKLFASPRKDKRWNGYIVAAG